MNTLKLKLLAASLFACTAAFAQANGPANLGSAPGQNGQPGSAAQSRGSFTNDSYVLQYGTSQYANVSQSGGGAGNTADILQCVDMDGEVYNTALQTQTHTGSQGRNTAYIAQDGDYSYASQTQTGGGNKANIDQGPNDESYNYATQLQAGDNNRAGIKQASNGNAARQIQNGNNNYATTDQTVVNSYSYATQNGTGNTSIVVQH